MRRIPGSHEPNAKNRSSKHLNGLTGVKSAYRSMNTAALKELAKRDGKYRDYIAERELARRDKKRAKKESKLA